MFNDFSNRHGPVLINGEVKNSLVLHKHKLVDLLPARLVVFLEHDVLIGVDDGAPVKVSELSRLCGQNVKTLNCVCNINFGPNLLNFIDHHEDDLLLRFVPLFLHHVEQVLLMARKVAKQIDIASVVHRIEAYFARGRMLSLHLFY